MVACVQDVRAWMSAQKWQRQAANGKRQAPKRQQKQQRQQQQQKPKGKWQGQKQLIEWVACDTRAWQGRVQRKINRFAIAL